LASSSAVPLAFIKDCIWAGRVRWTYHSTMRLRQRGLTADTLLSAVTSLEIIEAYPDDKYLPSFLVRGECEGSVFHAHIATDLEGANVRVVTMYEPSPDEWDEDTRVRRTK
jgi:hypothetical protein